MWIVLTKIKILRKNIIHYQPSTLNRESNANKALVKANPTAFSNLVTLYLLLQVPIEWEEVTVTPILLPDGKTTIPPAAINSMNKNKIGLKGN